MTYVHTQFLLLRFEAPRDLRFRLRFCLTILCRTLGCVTLLGLSSWRDIAIKCGDTTTPTATTQYGTLYANCQIRENIKSHFQHFYLAVSFSSPPPVKPEGTLGLNSVRLSVRLSVHPSVCLSVCLSVTLVFRTFLGYAFTYLNESR